MSASLVLYSPSPDPELPPVPVNPTLSFIPVILTRRARTSIPYQVPTSRSFTPPSYPKTISRTQAGTIVSRVWASKPGGGSLRIGYENIPDVSAEKLATMWDTARGRFYSLILPAAFFRGMHPSLQAALSLDGLPLKWGFAQPPTVRSIAPGISSVDLEFTARGYGGEAITILNDPRPPFVAEVSPLMALAPNAAPNS
jgi:hypothetical protein